MDILMTILIIVLAFAKLFLVLILIGAVYIWIKNNAKDKDLVILSKYTE